MSIFVRVGVIRIWGDGFSGTFHAEIWVNIIERSVFVINETSFVELFLVRTGFIADVGALDKFVV